MSVGTGTARTGAFGSAQSINWREISNWVWRRLRTMFLYTYVQNIQWRESRWPWLALKSEKLDEY